MQQYPYPVDRVQIGLFDAGINPISYGADWTDSKDSTAGLQAAIIAALAGDGRIILPQGVFRVSGNNLPCITIPAGSVTTPGPSLRFTGAGIGRTVIQVVGAAPTSVFDVLTNNVVFEKLTIDGGGVAGCGILFDDDEGADGGSYECTLYQVEIRNCRGTPGYGFTNTDRAYSLRLSECLVWNNNLAGYLIKRGQGLEASWCQFFNNTGVTVNGAPISQFAIGDGSSQLMSNMVFVGCSFEDPTSGVTSGAYLVGCSGIQALSMTGCYLNSKTTGSAHILINGAGTFARSFWGIRDLFIDSASTSPAMISVGTGVTPCYGVLTNAYAWSSSVVTAVSDSTNAAILYLFTVQGAGLTSSDTLGSGGPDLYGAAEMKTGNSTPVLERRTAGSGTLVSRVVGDTQPRLQINASGTIVFGPGGSTAPDSTLQRQGASKIGTSTSTAWQCGAGFQLSNFGSFQTGNHWSGTGAPASGSGANGDFYFRTDGTAGTSTLVYFKASGAWTGIL